MSKIRNNTISSPFDRSIDGIQVAGYDKDLRELYFGVPIAMEGSARTSSNGSSGPKLVAQATLDATGGQAQGTVNLGVSLPKDAVVTRSWLEVTTSFTSGGAATVALGIATDDATGILGATAMAGLAAGFVEGVQDGTAANFSTKTTAERELIATIATADLTAGKLNLFVEYVTSAA